MRPPRCVATTGDGPACRGCPGVAQPTAAGLRVTETWRWFTEKLGGMGVGVAHGRERFQCLLRRTSAHSNAHHALSEDNKQAFGGQHTRRGLCLCPAAEQQREDWWVSYFDTLALASPQRPRPRDTPASVCFGHCFHNCFRFKATMRKARSVCDCVHI